MHNLHISIECQNYFGGSEFGMNYNLHDLIYNYSKIHEDLLNEELDFLGTK